MLNWKQLIRRFFVSRLCQAADFAELFFGKWTPGPAPCEKKMRGKPGRQRYLRTMACRVNKKMPRLSGKEEL